MWEIKSYSEFQRKYSKEQLLGSGGFGQVFAGRRLADNRPIAVKEIDSKKVPEWIPWKYARSSNSSSTSISASASTSTSTTKGSNNIPIIDVENDGQIENSSSTTSSSSASSSMVPLEIEMTLQAQAVDGVIGVLDVFDTVDRSAFIMVLERPKSCIDLYDYVSQAKVLDEPTSRRFFVSINIFFVFVFKKMFNIFCSDLRT